MLNFCSLGPITDATTGPECMPILIATLCQAKNSNHHQRTGEIAGNRADLGPEPIPNKSHQHTEKIAGNHADSCPKSGRKSSQIYGSEIISSSSFRARSITCRARGSPRGRCSWTPPRGSTVQILRFCGGARHTQSAVRRHDPTTRSSAEHHGTARQTAAEEGKIARTVRGGARGARMVTTVTCLSAWSVGCSSTRFVTATYDTPTVSTLKTPKSLESSSKCEKRRLKRSVIWSALRI